MVDEEGFAKMLDRARELRAALDDHDAGVREEVLTAVRARVKFQPDPPEPPAGYLLLTAEIVELLDDTRLGPRQAVDLEHAFFGHEPPAL